MNLEEIINKLYGAFSACKRPEHFTEYDHCEECNDHDQMMLSATLESLDSKHLGNICWAPFCFLTEEGFSHYMPRIVELAITGKSNEHGGLFLLDILFNLAPEGDADRFMNYSKNQCNALLEALEYAKEKYISILTEEFYDEDMDIAIEYWRRKSI